MIQSVKTRAFTLLEVVVAVLAIGVLAAIAFSPHEEVTYQESSSHDVSAASEVVTTD